MKVYINRGVLSFYKGVGKFCRESKTDRVQKQGGIKKEEVGITEGQKFGYLTRSNSVLWCSPEPIPEASKPGTVGTRLGGTQPRLPPPPETNGATSEDQEDERNKSHPEGRRGVGGESRII